MQIIPLFLFLCSLPPQDSTGRVLHELERQLKCQASEGVDRYFHPEFEGTGFLSPPPHEIRQEKLGSVTVRSWTEKKSKPADSVLTLNQFFRDVASVTDARLKTLKVNGNGGIIKLVITGIRPSGARFHRKDVYSIEWKESGKNGWRIFRLHRKKGRWVESPRLLFRDGTDSLGLRLPVEVEREDLPVFMEPFSFLGGIAAGDYDRDGDLDLYVPRIGKNLLFRNEGGRFVKDGAVPDADVGASALFVDLDNDGWLDLLLANVASKNMPGKRVGRALAWYRNLGNGKFEDRTKASGLETRGPAMSLSASDVDRDGDLDFHVCFYKDFGETSENDYIPLPDNILQADNGVANQLWINQGDGTFREEAAKRGLADRGWSFAAAFADYDNDGDPDLTVANDFGKNRLYRNRGDGSFEDVTGKSGASDAGFGMGVSWGDIDGDGRLDMHVSNMYSTAGNRLLTAKDDPRLLKMARGNTLLRNSGGGSFEDVSGKAGVGHSGWAWSNSFLDYNSDGHPDLYVANGYMTGESRYDL
jgi:hypothetical protein